MNRCLALLALAVLGGCYTAAQGAAYKWTLQAPSSVVHAPGSKLRFTVETKTLDGKPIGNVPYVWVVDWVGLHGAEHNGESSREESILVKGGPGTAHLYILASDPNGRLVEVARTRFEVAYPQP
jgi:hypothetical protein